MKYFNKIYLIRCLIFFILTICIGLPLLLARAEEKPVFEVTGIGEPAKSNVIERLQYLQRKFPKPLSKPTVESFSNEAPNEIKMALDPFGYFNAQVKSYLVIKKSQWMVHFRILPGKPMKVTHVTVNITGEGADDPVFQQYLNNFPLQDNQTLNVDAYEKAKQGFFERASEHGYFQAKMLQSQIHIDPERYQAQIIFRFETGPRYLFGETEFSPSPFSLSFLNRFLNYEPGQYYEYEKLQKTQQDLIASNYFQQVIVNPLPAQAVQGLVPIKIELTPVKPQQYSLGVGYGTDTGFRGTFNAIFNRINQYGHRFSVLGQGSQTISQITANYMIPGFHPARDQFTLSGGIGTISQVTGNSDSGEISGGYSINFGDWQQSIVLTYLNENYDFTKPKVIDNHAQVLYPSINWHIRKTNNPLKPEQGFRITANLAGAPDPFSKLKNSGFFQAAGDAKVLLTLPTQTRLIARASFGTTVIQDLVHLPLSLQLFAGGSNSIRGFEYNSIGPGRNLAVGSIEVQQNIKNDLYIGAFVDTGNVTDISALHYLNVGVGPALVWLSPIGTLELTLAKPVNVAPNVLVSRNKRNWMVQFSMGPDL